MREILFRGKRIDNGEWLEGWYQPPVSGIHSDGRKEDLGASIAFVDYCGFLEDAFIIPETVGQFTGLTDTYGEKVFEGDILCFTDKNANYEWIGRVEFGNPNAEYNWGFQLVYINGVKPNTDILLWFDMEETGAFAEVIGNIHDNPELLKGGK